METQPEINAGRIHPLQRLSQPAGAGRLPQRQRSPAFGQVPRRPTAPSATPCFTCCGPKATISTASPAAAPCRHRIGKLPARASTGFESLCRPDRRSLPRRRPARAAHPERPRRGERFTMDYHARHLFMQVVNHGIEHHTRHRRLPRRLGPARPQNGQTGATCWPIPTHSRPGRARWPPGQRLGPPDPLAPAHPLSVAPHRQDRYSPG